ncbi:hypothetical protein LSCM1_00633 [Leishmania martiniquensis]|uniref:WW domain-containing protein n=1 Tax=Leishmania martiniquensis TaxID=1580590 RepID=A0A836FZ06_9TRYP|nr:hypothetical protein LSCM1_00633 [Leishmania martiniquensis]
MSGRSPSASRGGSQGSGKRSSSDEEEESCDSSLSRSEGSHTTTPASTSSDFTSSASGEDLSDDYGSGCSATSAVPTSASVSTSTTASRGTAYSDEGDSDPEDTEGAPRKLRRMEEMEQRLHDSLPMGGVSTLEPSAPKGASIFPAPSAPPVAAMRYGPVFSRPPPDAWAVPPPLPTLSASAKDISEMDVRAGLRLGVFRAARQLNKEQVMDEIESVRMTSHVERVLLEAPHQVALPPGVSPQEQEYAWATVFFSSAEAADLCAALLCQPGRRSKWARVSIQRLPVVSAVTEPHTAEEDQRVQVHIYQMNAAATDATKTEAAVIISGVPDTVLAQSAYGWCVLSTGGLFPTSGLAAYLQHRRVGDFTGIDVCASFDPQCGTDRCEAGGQCRGVHLRACEQWRLLVPPVLISRKAGVTAGIPTFTVTPPPESAWQEARRADTLMVMPLPPEIDEAAFVYMFRWCDGFLRAQTVRTVDAIRYGVVQFADAARAQRARQQAISQSMLPVRFVGERARTVDTTAASAASMDEAATKQPPLAAASSHHNSSNPVPSGDGAVAAPSTSATAATHAPDVPFPPLPGGWEYGLSRRTTQYFFLQSGKKSTTWKHPVTQERYKAYR